MSFDATANINSVSFDAQFEASVQIIVLPNPYEGPYEVTPQVSAQVLQTKLKSMTDDLTVKAVPFRTTANPQNGNTVYIAETVDD